MQKPEVSLVPALSLQVQEKYKKEWKARIGSTLTFLSVVFGLNLYWVYGDGFD